MWRDAPGTTSLPSALGWSFETTGAVDRAVAIILVGILLLLAHALGIEREILRYLWARP